MHGARKYRSSCAPHEARSSNLLAIPNTRLNLPPPFSSSKRLQRQRMLVRVLPESRTEPEEPPGTQSLCARCARCRPHPSRICRLIRPLSPIAPFAKFALWILIDIMIGAAGCGPVICMNAPRLESLQQPCAAYPTTFVLNLKRFAQEHHESKHSKLPFDPDACVDIQAQLGGSTQG